MSSTTAGRVMCPNVDSAGPSPLRYRSQTISFCEWESLLRMDHLRYCAVFGDKERIAGLLIGGQAAELPGDDLSKLR